MSAPDLSVIIPAFNEERFIARQIRELRRHSSALRALQIIIVDNGSTDRTVELARAAGVDLVLSAPGTVGSIRNFAARHASAEVFAFMDADVFPTCQWSERIAEVVQRVRSNPMLFTGSWVSVPDHCTWLERHWFKPLEHGKNSHINSGHMIVSRHLFERLGGFDARLKTGEDFDISMRAVAAGATLHDDLALRVIHEGYPQSVAEFMRREIWHGTGDWQTLRSLATSKVAWAAFIVLYGLLAGWLAGAMLGTPWPALLATIAALAVCVAASCYRYQGVGWRTRMATTVLYSVYFIARGLSPYALLSRATKRKPVHGARH